MRELDGPQLSEEHVRVFVGGLGDLLASSAQPHFARAIRQHIGNSCVGHRLVVEITGERLDQPHGLHGKRIELRQEKRHRSIGEPQRRGVVVLQARRERRESDTDAQRHGRAGNQHVVPAASLELYASSLDGPAEDPGYGRHASRPCAGKPTPPIRDRICTSAIHWLPCRVISTRTCAVPESSFRSPAARRKRPWRTAAATTSGDIFKPQLVDEDRRGLLQRVLERLDHRGGVVAVDEAMIERRRQIHHQPHGDLAVHHHRRARWPC